MIIFSKHKDKSHSVIYFGLYGNNGSKLKRNANIAASNKMSYIISLIERKNKLTVVSCASATLEKNETSRGMKNDNTKYVYCPINFHIPKIRNRLNSFVAQIWSFFYLLLCTNEKNVVIVYHNLSYMNLIAAVHRLRRFRFILEVEEIYSQSWKQFERYKDKEINYINSADSYIFASNNTARFLEVSSENSTTIHGSYYDYINECDRNALPRKLIYVGSIDTTKNGAFNAVECMKYLPLDYTLTIAGYGNEKAINLLLSMIKEINTYSKCERVKYLGKIEGDDLIQLLHSNDIALNAQKMGDYMENAFPSKVLTFLSCGLTVVSSPIKSIQESSLAPYISFAKSDLAADISNCIIATQRVNLLELKTKLISLDEEAEESLNRLIGELLC